jgi:DNA-binding response OmpR family regulator
LTPKEFSLLEYLLRHQGQAISRAMITEKVWGYGFDTYSNLIDVHINHLRKKVDRGFPTKLIHTVKGVGYVLEARGPDA